MRKIFLTFNNEDCSPEYERIIGPRVFELKNIENASCDELLCIDCIDYVDFDSRDRALNTWIDKIRLGGKLTITGRDIFAVCKGFTNRLISSKDFNFLVYQDRSSISDMQEVIDLLLNRGFKIMTKKIDNMYWCVSAERSL